MPSSRPALGCTAVILCGPGTSLYPFTASDDMPKALLPIANKPMLHYPLEWCEKAGFDSILILTLNEHLAAIQSFVRTHRISKPSTSSATPTTPSTASIPYIAVHSTSSINENLGTADVLRTAYRKNWLNSDFCVLPCDLVTNLDGERLAELWMTMQAGFDSDLGRRSRKHSSVGEGEDGRRGGMTVWYQTMGEGAIKGQETDFISTAPLAKPGSLIGGGHQLPDGDIGTLLTAAPATSLKESGNVTIRHTMLAQHPDVKLYSTFRDSGIYFFAHWVLKFIDRNEALSSLREDVLPWLVRARWQADKISRKLGLFDILVTGESSSSELAGVNAETDSNPDTNATRYDIGSMSSSQVRRPSTSSDPSNPLSGRRNSNSRGRRPSAGSTAAERLAPQLTKKPIVPPVIAYLPNTPSCFLRRVDTVHLLLFSSLRLAQAENVVHIDPSANIDPKAYISAPDSLVAEKASIAERVAIKKCVIGPGCSIGKNVKLTGCVLMEGASVAENSKLEGCIVGRRAMVGAKVVLKDCEIAEKFYVDDFTEAKGERFTGGIEQVSEGDFGTDDDGSDGGDEKEIGGDSGEDDA